MSTMTTKLISRPAVVSRLLCGARSPLRIERTLAAHKQDPNMAENKAVTMENINPNILRLEYAVRGPLVIRAAEIEKELEKGARKPFSKVIKANIGDAHAMGQVPITFIRQVLACVTYPDLIDKADFPPDVKKRARDILGACGGGSIGSYTASHGIEQIRQHVAEYIERRDCHPARWQDICLSAGASTGIKNVLQLLCNHLDGKPSGVMIPIPQYPLYSASLAEYGLTQVGYYLDEEAQWGLAMDELERSYKEAQKDCNVRALVVINPGNPTGQVLTRSNIESIIKFAHAHRLLVFADEVYQDNVYAEGSQFHSFKKVLRELGEPYSSTLELASFMSISKGYMGECGLRGGWAELVNLAPPVQAQLYKCVSAMLCPSALGQAAIDCVAKPPMPGEPSYEQWAREKANVLSSLRERATLIADTFNQMEGFKCNVVQVSAWSPGAGSGSGPARYTSAPPSCRSPSCSSRCWTPSSSSTRPSPPSTRNHRAPPRDTGRINHTPRH
ncbi:hypothetical protein JYU34_020771 [Plutella xylostella]|uniref:alanine transaminase n=1 Tax=Plutella xylostella TaxID=51655 RepID=A0ABQ7PTC2_PLUXY|nr:hypothetical protein JYU34_020771 [Plutella xylostella]